MTTAASSTGRPNQRTRTRKALLEAAARLMAQFREPSLDEVAAEALVSRATAYRYFPNVEALMVEAALDIGTPKGEELFRRDRSTDAAARLDRADAALDDFIVANEPMMRRMLIYSLQQELNGDGDTPKRQNRRGPLIDAALEPERKAFKPAQLQMLKRALAMVIGTESMIATRDVLGLDHAEARKVKRWAIKALVDAAKRG